MKTWILISLAVGLLLIAGIVAVNTLNTDTTTDVKQGKSLTCSSCSGSCTAQKNCGLATCSAVNGGTCGCRK